MVRFFLIFFFFFNDTAPTEIYTLSLHDALPIPIRPTPSSSRRGAAGRRIGTNCPGRRRSPVTGLEALTGPLRPASGSHHVLARPACRSATSQLAWSHSSSPCDQGTAVSRLNTRSSASLPGQTPILLLSG